ncbi:hypothetical protein M2375_003502 [Comamonas sp. BIGb0152]|uniref:hypothetical protein n=1 Tax=Comamonas sp. BIGb0152 TaxID=2940601 RepID=UPI002167630D|nr:hypothetical protein [Comamonas sp. BIGb0152]MCS4295260.1 hypothetical protein [Comamonas sp. BIGb0152]
MAADRPLLKPLRPLAAGAFYCASALLLGGCSVVAVGAAAVSVTATAVGLAADAAVGTVKVVGKGVGKAYDMATGEEPDNSGITVRYRERRPGETFPPQQPSEPPPLQAQPSPAARPAAAPETAIPSSP